MDKIVQSTLQGLIPLKLPTSIYLNSTEVKNITYLNRPIENPDTKLVLNFQQSMTTHREIHLGQEAKRPTVTSVH